MLNAIHLNPDQVPAQLKGGYRGKKFRAEVTNEMTIPIDNGLWSGGSRDLYQAINIQTGQRVDFPGRSEAPWGQRQEIRISMLPEIAIVCKTIFCGKDMGLTFYLHPDNAAKLLPAPAPELCAHEKLVLNATASYKSSYMGRDRYQMARENARYGDTSGFPSRQEWEIAKANLISKGLLNKAGAITVAGRNAR